MGHQTPCVVGFGDPVMDILANVSHVLLAQVAEEPGGCISVSPEEMAKLTALASQHAKLKRVPGGSAANVMKGLANISQGTSFTPRFLGMIGLDPTGLEYKSGLIQQKVEPLLLVSLAEASSDSPTASALCLVTPDGQRTMRTCLGASSEFKDVSQLVSDWKSNIRHLHCEGYCLYRSALSQEVMRQAKEAGATVSMDLASFETVRHCKSALLSILEAGYLDVLFANEEEAATMGQVFELCKPEGVFRLYDVLFKYSDG